MAWRRASIVGVGATRQGKLPGETPLSLAAQAFRLALADGGIDKREVDGLLTMPGTTSPEGAKNYLNVGELLGVNPRFTGSMTMGGATGGALVQIAAMAIATGMARTVACIFADTARTGGSRFAAAAGATILGRMGHVRQCATAPWVSPPHGALRHALRASRLDRGHLPQACRAQSRRRHA
jgi:acetyl-CoA acetyltransferase